MSDFTNYEMLGNKVLLRQKIPERYGHIIVQDGLNLEGDCSQGQVLATGPGQLLKDGKMRVPPMFEPGDLVLYDGRVARRMFPRAKARDENSLLRIVDVDDVIAVIDEYLDLSAAP